MPLRSLVGGGVLYIMCIVPGWVAGHCPGARAAWSRIRARCVLFRFRVSLVPAPGPSASLSLSLGLSLALLPPSFARSLARSCLLAYRPHTAVSLPQIFRECGEDVEQPPLRVPPGGILINAGVSHDSLFLVLEGELVVTKSFKVLDEHSRDEHSREGGSEGGGSGTSPREVAREVA